MSGSSGRRVGRAQFVRAVFGAVSAGLLLGVALAAGGIHETYASLVAMGFDPDRAEFIRALLFGLMIAIVAGIASGQRATATCLGLVVTVGLFGQTFVGETNAAVGSTGAAGVFDPSGWLLTLVTVGFTALVASWSGSALAGSMRPAVLDAGTAGVDIVRQRHVDRRALIKVGRVLVILALILLTLPVLGDIVNYSPDAHMLRGPQLPQSTDPGTAPGAAANLGHEPWQGWRPVGPGQLHQGSLRAPWGDESAGVEVDVYTPPGYDSDPQRRYPTLYEVPWSAAIWNSAMNTTATLDAMIDSGSIPPVIVVFADSWGSPYPDTVCADSFDGREWYDRWVGETLVPSIDSKYRTIAQAPARAVMGMSEGGFCAAILAMHHADLFGTSIAFSGYFHAGVAGGASALPFGNQPKLIDDYSPDVFAPRPPPDARARLFFILVAEPTQESYGRQATGFDAMLISLGYPQSLIQTRMPHGWVQVRNELQPVLSAWAGWMVQTSAL